MSRSVGEQAFMWKYLRLQTFIRTLQRHTVCEALQYSDEYFETLRGRVDVAVGQGQLRQAEARRLDTILHIRAQYNSDSTTLFRLTDEDMTAQMQNLGYLLHRV